MSYFIDHGKIVSSWLVQKRLFNLNKREINKLKAIKKVYIFCFYQFIMLLENYPLESGEAFCWAFNVHAMASSIIQLSKLHKVIHLWKNNNNFFKSINY